MLRIFIDDFEVDVDGRAKISIRGAVAFRQKLTDLMNSNEALLDLPITVKNAEIFGYAYEPNGVAMFNDSKHECAVVVDGAKIMVGNIYLKRAVKSRVAVGAAGGRFICAVKQPYGWVEGVNEMMFNELQIPFDVTMNAATIKDSWTWSNPVKFLPVRRDTFISDASSSEMIPTIQIMQPQNYHPFIHIRSAMECVAAMMGYRIESEFMNEPMFDSLYVSGNYPKTEQMTAAIKNQQDFCAGRFGSVSTTADDYGRVYTETDRAQNTLGNVVETANPHLLGPDGTPVDGVFNVNNCFRSENGMAYFQPVIECVAGLEYNLSYKTDYKIVDRTTLKGFDTLKVGNVTYKYKIPNVFVDKREQLQNGYGYRVVVFDHTAVNYLLYIDTDAGQATEPNVSFSDRTYRFTATFEGQAVGCRLMYKPRSSLFYQPYTGDWAIYDSIVAENGRMNIGIILRTQYARLTPSQRLAIDGVVFSGAEAGMAITLANTTTVRPVYLPSPGDGSKLKFKDVAANEVRLIRLFEGVQHMFNLRFFTDHMNKRVVVEPFDRFYTEKTVNWTDKVDRTAEVEIEELGLDMPRKMRFRYGDGDGSVARLNMSQQSIYGSWVAQCGKSVGGKDSVENVNPMFTATLSKDNEFPYGVDASLIQVGDRGQHRDVLSEDLTFPPKVVSYQGVVKLPDGQQWGYPSYSDSFPLVTFYDRQRGVSLRFDDSADVPGLHKYYDRWLEMANRGRRVTINLWLTPNDVEQCMDSRIDGGLFRALFLIDVAGETLRLRLEEIVDYDPTGGRSTKCIFIKEIL